MSYTDLLCHTCTIWRYTEGAKDDYGNPVKIWAGDPSTQLCRLEASSRLGGREIKIGAEVVIADYRLFISSDVEINEQNRIVIDGVTYEVLLVENFTDYSSAHHKQCWLRVVR